LLKQLITFHFVVDGINRDIGVQFQTGSFGRVGFQFTNTACGMCNLSLQIGELDNIEIDEG